MDDLQVAKDEANCSGTVHVAIRAAIGAGVLAAFSVVKDLLALTTVALVALTAVDFGRGTCSTLSKSQSLGHRAYLVQFPHTHSGG